MAMLASGSLLAAVRPDGLRDVLAACARAGVPAAAIGTIEERDAGFHWNVDGRKQALPVFARDEVSRALADADGWSS
jgi:hydrogenase maturation factor